MIKSLLILILLVPFCVASQAIEISPAAMNVAEAKERFSEARRLYEKGDYEATIQELNGLEPKTPEARGLVQYWKGIAFNRLQDYPSAIASFEKSLEMNFAPRDIHYEYGQALFAVEKLTEARIQFSESVKKSFKRPVSLYYIGYLSRQLGENKKALTFYQAIDKLGEEATEVQQAAHVQIGDIFLEQIENNRGSSTEIDKYVLPQYQHALKINNQSPMAPIIREKIKNLQRKYELVLFKLRNGRPVLNPPYFVRAALEVGIDSNVTFAPAETTIERSKQSSAFLRGSAIGRYTFYLKNYLSLSPELKLNRTHYFKRVPEIYRNDNYLIAPAFRTSYEHSLLDRPASFLVDYEFADARRDVKAKKNLEFSSRAHTVMLGERFLLFPTAETIVRVKQRIFESFLGSADARTTSFILEQAGPAGYLTFLFYLSYDRTRVNNNIFDTNSYTFRTDVIMPRVGNLFTPSFGMGFTSIDPIKDEDVRGKEHLVNPNIRLSRRFGKSWRANLKYDYQNYYSRDEERFAYQKSIYSFELEYLF